MKNVLKGTLLLSFLFALTSCEKEENTDGQKEYPVLYSVYIDESDAKFLLKSGDEIVPAASQKLDITLKVKVTELKEEGNGNGGQTIVTEKTVFKSFDTNPSGNIHVTFGKSSSGKPYDASQQVFHFDTELGSTQDQKAPKITEVIPVNFVFSIVYNNKRYKKEYTFDGYDYLWNEMGLNLFFPSDLPTFELRKPNGRGGWCVKLTEDIVLE